MRKAFIILLLLTGCATSATKLTHLYQGMPLEEVKSELGTPDHERGDGALVYKLDDGGFLASDYIVYIQNGKLASWQRAAGPIDYEARARAAKAFSDSVNRQNASQGQSCHTVPDGNGGFRTNCN